MKGLGKIFSFTFVQHIKQKGYRNVTIIVALLCLALPAAIMPAMEYFKDDGTYVSKIDRIYVVEKSAGTEGEMDYGVLNSVDPERFANVEYVMEESVEEAAKKAEKEAVKKAEKAEASEK